MCSVCFLRSPETLQEIDLVLQIDFQANRFRSNIRIDEDVLIKANIFALVIRLQKTFSRRLQDVLVKTDMFVIAICLQGVFKTSSRRLAKTS